MAADRGPDGKIRDDSGGGRFSPGAEQPFAKRFGGQDGDWSANRQRSNRRRNGGDHNRQSKRRHTKGADEHREFHGSRSGGQLSS